MLDVAPASRRRFVECEILLTVLFNPKSTFRIPKSFEEFHPDHQSQKSEVRNRDAGIAEYRTGPSGKTADVSAEKETAYRAGGCGQDAHENHAATSSTTSFSSFSTSAGID
jgi:hypothetical protein